MLDIQQLPVLTDNYIYLLRCTETGTTAVVDPAQAQPVMAALGATKLDMILNTHHHNDHVGGNAALVDQYGCTVIGAAVDAARIPCIRQQVAEGDTVHVGHCAATVLFVPGHTRGHIAYYFAKDSALFCGDTLFAGGCGRLFEGTPEQMFASLQKLAALPDDTRIFCAHEYTQANMAFACHIAPDNPAIAERAGNVSRLREQGKPTVPSTLGVEKKTNVFLLAKTTDTFAELRRKKDSF
ncbi:MAG: hydroxyacylglutathione hydrolase [Proteobacteria bacterium]|nr:hydroxyacylglutathione hydrolase [Pseudomonadota bacterium]